MKKKLIILLSVLALLSVAIIVFYNYDTCKKEDSAICSLTINNKRIDLEVAYSSSKQQRGLMFVEELGQNQGMIFVYDRERYMSFWMKNTLIPLSIAFVKYDGRITDIHNMYPEPYNTDANLIRYNSSESVLYAIETPLNWFSVNHVKVGDYIKIPKVLK